MRHSLLRLSLSACALALACAPATAQFDRARSGKVDTLASNPVKLAYVSQNLARNQTATYRYLDDLYILQTGNANNLQLVLDPKGSGRKVLQFTVRNTDPLYAGGSRTEIALKYDYVMEGLRWYAFSVLFPTGWVFHPSPTVVAQLHTSQKTLSVPPPVSVVASGTDLNMEFHYNYRNTDGTGTNPATRANTGQQLVRLAKIQTNKWYCFVVRADWSYKPGLGSVKAWMNGNVAYETKNAFNAYQTWLGNYPKVGAYLPGTMAVPSRTLYTDFIYTGGATSTFDQMTALTPCGATISPTPAVIK